MNHKILKIALLIAIISISTNFGTKLYNLDAKEVMEYFVSYVIFVFGYFSVGLIILLTRLNSRKSVKGLAVQFLISLILLFAIPYGFNRKKAQENQILVENMKQKEHQKFLVDLERINIIIDEHPDSAILYVKRGQLKRSQGLWEESITDSKISLEKKKNTHAYWELGWCQEHLGYLEEALVSYKRAALIDSSLDWPQKRMEVVKRKIKKSL